MKQYVLSASCVSAQDFSGAALPAQWRQPEGQRLPLADPVYEDHIDVKLIRRMGRLLKMSSVAALDAVRQLGTFKPDAIIAGTAWGCLQDTEAFLKKMTEQQEAFLTPTAFIQSTHNTVAAQVALMLQSHAYNNTIVHRGFSFEHALMDTDLLLGEDPHRQILTGGVDELTDISIHLLQRLGVYGREGNATRGAAAGEGAAFFVLSGEAQNHHLAVLNGFRTVYEPKGADWQDSLDAFLLSMQTSAAEIDLVLTGIPMERPMGMLSNGYFEKAMPAAQVLSYKKYCGEYPTAAAFACWMATGILAAGAIPGDLPGAGKSVGKVLICNQYLNRYFSFMLLSHAER
jgi:hypothetical protein